MNARLLLEKPPRAGQQSCRLLLLSYHFPPSVAVGARRWEQFAHFIAARGWGLDVVMCDQPVGDDGARLATLPDGIRVYGVEQPVLVAEHIEHALWRGYRTVNPRRRPARVQDGAAADTAQAIEAGPVSVYRTEMRWPPRTPREFVRLGGAAVIGARERAWARRAAATAIGLTVPGVHRAIISSGPPHMAHVGARQASLATGLPLVVDLRDPWSLLPMLHETIASPWWYRTARRYERQVIEHASVIVANTDPARDGLAALYPDAAARMITVLNGTDSYPLPPSRRGGRFTIGFAGTIYLGRDVENLFLAAARVIREHGLTPADFGLDFIGEFDRPGELSIGALARAAGIAEFVTVGPRCAHAAALEFLAQATMLVVFVGFGPVFIPAKTFEYMRFDAWLLALTQPASATAQLLAGTDADIVAPDDVPAIAAAIGARYAQHRQGVVPAGIAGQSGGRFSRAAQATVLLDAIERVFAQPAPVPAPERSARTAES